MEGGKYVHLLKAQDGLVEANTVFMFAVFIGLTLGRKSLENRDCDASVGVENELVVFEVVSIIFFLLSLLAALGSKLAYELISAKQLRFAILFGSALCFVMGIVFMVLSVVNIIQIRLGMVSCGSNPASLAIGLLVVPVAPALFFYMWAVVRAAFLAPSEIEIQS